MYFGFSKDTMEVMLCQSYYNYKTILGMVNLLLEDANGFKNINQENYSYELIYREHEKYGFIQLVKNESIPNVSSSSMMKAKEVCYYKNVCIYLYHQQEKITSIQNTNKVIYALHFIFYNLF